jgi:hypothetical protein
MEVFRNSDQPNNGDRSTYFVIIVHFLSSTYSPCYLFHSMYLVIIKRCVSKGGGYMHSSTYSPCYLFHSTYLVIIVPYFFLSQK